MINKKSKFIDWNKYALSGSEDAIQIALFGWAALPENLKIYPELRLMFAIPNGMHTPNKVAAGRMRAMGMKTGVLDILLPVKREPFSGLFIELKRPKTKTQRAGTTSTAQDEWIDDLKAQGFGAIICYSFEEARKIICEYLDYRPPVEVKKEWSKQDKKLFETGEWK